MQNEASYSGFKPSSKMGSIYKPKRTDNDVEDGWDEEDFEENFEEHSMSSPKIANGTSEKDIWKAFEKAEEKEEKIVTNKRSFTTAKQLLEKNKKLKTASSVSGFTGL